MKGFVVTSACGQRELPDVDPGEDRKYWQSNVFSFNSVIGEMPQRFLDEEIVKVSKGADAVVTLKDDDTAVEDLLTTYSNMLQINHSLLKAEMQIIRAAGLERFSSCNEEHFCPPATSSELNELKNYPNYFKLLQLVLTLPVSSSTCERSFSAMRRVRNYLQTTMSAQRFSFLGSTP